MTLSFWLKMQKACSEHQFRVLCLCLRWQKCSEDQDINSIYTIKQEVSCMPETLCKGGSAYKAKGHHAQTSALFL